MSTAAIRLIAPTPKVAATSGTPRVGDPADAFERDADRIAEEINRREEIASPQRMKATEEKIKNDPDV